MRATETWPVLPDQPGQGRVALAWSGYDGVDADRVSLSLRQAAGAATSFGVDASSVSDGDWDAAAVVRQDVSGAIRIDGVSILAGLGQREDAGDRRTTLRLGGRIDRGVRQGPGLGGWLSVDAEARIGGDETTELTGSTELGLRAFEGLSLTGGIAVTGSTEDDRLDTRLSSALVGDVGTRGHVAVGASVGLDEGSAPGVHIGTWLEF